ncbi:HNH endonuclease [Sporosalibacterium faouarense]|uniref:HNH endonuclease n=1 Tax=Sporosalibacterium faouarense TaxID=516123 RepID=UPI00141CD5B4|nr:HNH endonuclease signature motif containing protein [Sporosalibacterium faouarense]MTI46249.1 HNH endonuclease [Bacillota bacterium]
MKPRNKEKIYIYEREDKKCFYCGKKLTFRQMTLDHFLPLSKKGTNVEDGIILGEGLNIDNKELREILLEVIKIEDITDRFVLQSNNLRFYIENNLVKKVVYIGGNNEYNHNFSW